MPDLPDRHPGYPFIVSGCKRTGGLGGGASREFRYDVGRTYGVPVKSSPASPAGLWRRIRYSSARQTNHGPAVLRACTIAMVFMMVKRLEKMMQKSCDLIGCGIQDEMPSVQDVDLGSRYIPPIRFRLRDIE